MEVFYVDLVQGREQLALDSADDCNCYDSRYCNCECFDGHFDEVECPDGGCY